MSGRITHPPSPQPQLPLSFTLRLTPTETAQFVPSDNFNFGDPASTPSATAATWRRVTSRRHGDVRGARSSPPRSHLPASSASARSPLRGAAPSSACRRRRAPGAASSPDPPRSSERLRRSPSRPLIPAIGGVAAAAGAARGARARRGSSER